MSAAAVSVLVGALASQGLGEARLSGVGQIEIDSRVVRVVARFDSAHKVESGRGWIGSASATGKVGALRLGASFVHRDGGAWTKNTVWLEPGVAIGPVEISARAAVSGATEHEMGGRALLNIGRRVQWEGQALRHHQGDLGFTSALSFRIGGRQ